MKSTLINYERVGLPAMRAAVACIVDEMPGSASYDSATRARAVGRKLVAAFGDRPLSDMLAVELSLARIPISVLQLVARGVVAGVPAFKLPPMVSDFLSAAFEADGVGGVS